MLDWLLKNKEWLLSGAGLFILTTLFAVARYFLSRRSLQPTITIGHNTGQIAIGESATATNANARQETASVGELIRIVELRRDDVNSRLDKMIENLEAKLQKYKAEGFHFREDDGGPSIEFIGGHEWHFRCELLEFKTDFNDIVAQKLTALRSGHLVLAHELTVKIHKLAYDLDVREQEARELRDFAAGCSIHAMNAADFSLRVAMFLKECLLPYIQAVRIEET